MTLKIFYTDKAPETIKVKRFSDLSTHLTDYYYFEKPYKSGKGYFFGLGRWTRGNTECCLIATKGKIQRLNNSISQLIISPLTKHSEKPDIVREKIVDLVGELPRIELFARQQVDGFDCWGNEV